MSGKAYFKAYVHTIIFSTEETVRYVYKHIVLAMVVRECFASLGEDNECCCNLSAYVYSNIRREGKQIDLPWN